MSPRWSPAEDRERIVNSTLERPSIGAGDRHRPQKVIHRTRLHRHNHRIGEHQKRAPGEALASCPKDRETSLSVMSQIGRIRYRGRCRSNPGRRVEADRYQPSASRTVTCCGRPSHYDPRTPVFTECEVKTASVYGGQSVAHVAGQASRHCHSQKCWICLSGCVENGTSRNVQIL